MNLNSLEAKNGIRVHWGPGRLSFATALASQDAKLGVL